MSVKKYNDYIKENSDEEISYEHDNIINDIKKTIEENINSGYTNEEILHWMEEYPVGKNELIHIIRQYIQEVNR